MLWKCNWESECGLKLVKNLDVVDPECFEDLICNCWSKDAPVPAEKLVKYIVESQRRELLSLITVETALRMLYDTSTRKAGMLNGDDYLRFDRAHCLPEQRQIFRKIVLLKNQFKQEYYTNSYPYETAVFEICRRNDAEMLKIYLDELQGYCPSGLYDDIFDYYIYMYLSEWDLLKQYNDDNERVYEFPGCCNDGSDIVSREIQQELLEFLIQQAAKCGAAAPETLKILFEHNFRSCRSAFPMREQCVHLGTEFSNRDVFSTDYAERILFHYEDKELAPDNCIDPWDFNDLLTDSCCAVPVTCTCGHEGCGGITAVSESWVMGNEMRLYIPVMEKVFYFRIKDRIALKKELLMMLEQAICNVQRYKKWCKKTTGKYDEEDAPILPYGTSLYSWRKLCLEISESLDRLKA